MQRLATPVQMNRLRPATPRLAASVLVALVLLGLMGCREARELPRVRVAQGELSRTLVESGEIAAIHSSTLRAPLEWGGDLQIIEMAPEGILVEKGDFLMRFDSGFLEKELEETRAELEAKEAERLGVLAEQASRELQQENAITTAQLSRDLAELQIEEMKYESENRRADAELRLKQALVSLEETSTKLQAQAVLDSLQLAKIDVEIAGLRARGAGMQDRIAGLTLSAPDAGLVLHADQRREGQRVKVRIGDKIRPRGKVLEIPDPSSMQVRFLVHEIDRHRVELGQPVTVVLEAAPERSFRGELTEISRLATPRVDEGRVKGFEVSARIEGQDVLLRPGMSARVEVELSRFDVGPLVPLEAVFEREGETVVFPAERWPEPLLLLAGPMNRQYMALAQPTTGLSAGVELIAKAPDLATRPWGEARSLGEESP